MQTRLALGVFAYMRSASLWQRVVVLPGTFTAASLITWLYFRANVSGWKSVSMWDTLRMLTDFGLIVIAPLLVFGFLALGRYAFNRWLQAA